MSRSIKAHEKLHAERAAASQKVAAAVSKTIVKLKKSGELAADLTQKLSKEKNRVAAATSLANAAIMCEQQAEHGVVRSTGRRLEEKYRIIIKKLQDELKSSNVSFKNATIDRHQKDREIDELKSTIQV